MRRLAALLVWLGLSGQESPGLFQISLPDFFETSFSGTNTLIELPDRPIKRLSILVRDAQKRNINPGRYKIFVNGKGLGNVVEERTTLDGALLVMEPEALRRRPDELFDPRENAVEITAEDRRGRIYYQNWILRVNDVDRNALFGYSSSISPDDPRAVPPDLVITEPKAPPVLKANQSSARVTIRGRLSPGATLKVNGQVALTGKLDALATFEYAATVAARQHELILEASDSKGNTRKVIVPVHGPPSATPRVHFNGQKYAVLIGVSNFGSTSQSPPPLPLAAAEVQELARVLEQQSGFKRENIRLLTDEKGTVEQVRTAFSDFTAKAQPNDILLIYIVTHGVHDPRPNRVNKLYLALNGTQIATLDSTALPFSDLEILLNRSIRTDNCFLIFDIGHELNDDWNFHAGRNLVNNHVLNLFSDKPGWSVLVSASSGEVAASSLFSHSLTQGLSGSADLNGDGVVTGKELYAFVSESVKRESQGKQQPRFKAASQSGDAALNDK